MTKTQASLPGALSATPSQPAPVIPTLATLDLPGVSAKGPITFFNASLVKATVTTATAWRSEGHVGKPAGSPPQVLKTACPGARHHPLYLGSVCCPCHGRRHLGGAQPLSPSASARPRCSLTGRSFSEEGARGGSEDPGARATPVQNHTASTPT